MYRWSTVMTITAAGLTAAILLSFGGELLRVFGKEFICSQRLFWLVMASALLEAAACHSYQATFAKDSLWWQVVVITFWSLLLVTATNLAVPRWGAGGLAAAYAIAWASSSLMYSTMAVTVRSHLEAKAE
jgi:O-antigen/teichoic acid export membrane protein